MKKHLLVVDSDDTIRRLCRKIFNGELYETFVASDAKEAFRLLDRFPIDIVLLNQTLPDRNGLEVLEEIKSTNSDIGVVMISARGSVEQAVQSMKRGADDFIEKPFLDLDMLKDTVDGVLEKVEKHHLKHSSSRAEPNNINLIGESEPMKKLKVLIKKAAPLDSTVLIVGETGTGKEVIARKIHSMSNRIHAKFVPVHCAGIPETLLESTLFGHEKGAFTGAYRTRKGYFEIADKGTIFLDEIGDTMQSIQVKLLRVLQDKQFRRVGGLETLYTDARIIAATNRDLEREVERERFRQDLYYRLNVITIRVPPLRERADDIPLLANYFFKNYVHKHGKFGLKLSDQVLEFFYRHPWNGNVRELENVIERVVALSDSTEIRVSDLPENFRNRASSLTLSNASFFPFAAAKNSFEKRYVIELLQRTGGNVSKAARLAGMPRQNLHLKIKKHGLKTAEILQGMSSGNGRKSLFDDNVIST